jgi:ribosomal protein S18 acetylase RimI-like enzyme
LGVDLTIRPAEAADGPALGRMGAALAQLHHDFDPPRFMTLPASGYEHWLVSESRRKGAIVIVAVLDGEVVGYAYGALEDRDWNALREACGGFHDLWVEERARRHGAGEKLAEELMRRLVELGAPRVVLSTAVKNAPAQRLFTRLGWRPTMVEMTRESV